MPDLDSTISNILSDPNKLSEILSLASNFLGSDTNNASEQANEQTPKADTPDLGTLLKSINISKDTSVYDNDITTDIISKAIPAITSIAQSGQNAINKDKLNLLKSIKPFTANDVGSQIDHAIRLISMAKMAKSAIGSFSPQKRKEE